MPKYRKKPIVIEAFQYREKGSTPVPDWFTEAMLSGKAGFQRSGALSPVLISTLEGVMVANPGDYIIQGVNGEIYPCKPDIFAKTYEEVS